MVVLDETARGLAHADVQGHVPGGAHEQDLAVLAALVQGDLVQEGRHAQLALRAHPVAPAGLRAQGEQALARERRRNL